MQIKRHLERLCDLEYLAVRGGRNGSAFQYELLIGAGVPAEEWGGWFAEERAIARKIPV
jgi:hypothetical protein